jgi:Yip1 domain
MIPGLADLVKLTLEDPRRGVRAVLNLGIPLPARTAALLLVAVGSALLTHLGFLVLPPSEDPVMAFITGSPLRTAVVQWVILACTVVLIDRVGRARGGTGNLADALLIVVWVQVIMLGLQVVQLVALLVAPPLAMIINLGGLALFFWLLTNFIAELHGFASRGAVFVGIVVTGFAVAFVLILVLTLIVGPEALSNV